MNGRLSKTFRAAKNMGAYLGETAAAFGEKAAAAAAAAGKKAAAAGTVAQAAMEKAATAVKTYRSEQTARDKAFKNVSDIQKKLMPLAEKPNSKEKTALQNELALARERLEVATNAEKDAAAEAARKKREADAAAAEAAAKSADAAAAAALVGPLKNSSTKTRNYTCKCTKKEGNAANSGSASKPSTGGKRKRATARRNKRKRGTRRN
jgi:hypothetical protein